MVTRQGRGGRGGEEKGGGDLHSRERDGPSIFDMRRGRGEESAILFSFARRSVPLSTPLTAAEKGKEEGGGGGSGHLVEGKEERVRGRAFSSLWRRGGKRESRLSFSRS